MDNLLFRIEVQGLTEQVKELGRLKTEMASMADEVKKLNVEYKNGNITSDQFNREIGTLGLKMNACKQETNALARETQATATAFKGAEGSMVRLAQELGNNREKYRALSQAERENAEVGGKLLTTIQAQDTQIKKLDASLGNHQRNVGNYQKIWHGVLEELALTGGVVGVALMAFGTLKDAMVDGVKDAMNEERSQNLLKFALNGNADAAERMLRFKEKMVKGTMFSKDEIADTINLGLSMGRTELETKKLVETAMGLSRVTGKDLHEMMLALSGTYEGQTGRLGKLSGELKNLSIEQLKNGEAVDILNKKYGKYASEGIDSMEGKVNGMHKWWKEKWEGAGFVFMDFIQKMELGFKTIQAMSGGGITSGELGASKAAATKAQLLSAHQAKMDQINAEIDHTKELLKVNLATQKEATPIDPKAAAAAEKARAEYESNLKTRTAVIKSNNDYILTLARKAIDDQIAAMADGKEKEKAIDNDKYQDEIININKERRDRLEAINATIKDTKAKGDQLKTLEAQKVAISEGANKQIEALQAAHDKTLNDIDKKFSKQAEDDKITSKYGNDVAKVTEESQMQLDVLRAFYASKGTLTKEEEQKLHDEELKLAINVAQKKYDLLYNEIQARKSLGTITQEEYDKQLASIARLYGEVKKLGGEQQDNKDSAKKKPDALTGGIMDMFQIPESEAAKIKQQVGKLLSQIGGMWMDAQKTRISSELKAETAKVDKTHDIAVKSLDAQKKKGLITEAQYNARKDKLDQEAAKKKDDLNREAFEKNKKLQLLNAVINGAMAVIAAAMTPVIGIVMAVLAGIMVAAEIATIAGTKYEGAKGGMLRGPSHSQGGIKYAMGGDVLELEGGEAVLNKRAMESGDQMTVSGTPRQIASRVNSYRGWGVPFAEGGYLPAANPVRRSGVASASGMTEAITRAINDQKVYIVESEFTQIQGKVKKVQVEATW